MGFGGEIDRNWLLCNAPSCLSATKSQCVLRGKTLRLIDVIRISESLWHDMAIGSCSRIKISFVGAFPASLTGSPGSVDSAAVESAVAGTIELRSGSNVIQFDSACCRGSVFSLPIYLIEVIERVGAAGYTVVIGDGQAPTLLARSHPTGDRVTLSGLFSEQEIWGSRSDHREAISDFARQLLARVSDQFGSHSALAQRLRVDYRSLLTELQDYPSDGSGGGFCLVPFFDHRSFDVSDPFTVHDFELTLFALECWQGASGPHVRLGTPFIPLEPAVARIKAVVNQLGAGASQTLLVSGFWDESLLLLRRGETVTIRHSGSETCITASVDDCRRALAGVLESVRRAMLRWAPDAHLWERFEELYLSKASTPAPNAAAAVLR